MASRKKICCVLLVAAAVGVGIFLVYPRGLGPTSFKKIRAGMTVEQVEDLLRMRHGDHYTRPKSVDWRAPYYGLRGRGGDIIENLSKQTRKIGEKNVSVKLWRDNNYAVHVAFDDEGGAIAWSLHEYIVTED